MSPNRARRDMLHGLQRGQRATNSEHARGRFRLAESGIQCSDLTASEPPRAMFS